MVIKNFSSLQKLIVSSLFVALIIVGAFIKIPVPVVPFTLQFLFTNLAALMLGHFYGSLSVLVYIILGLCGLPVFSQGGGFFYVLNPSFGYIIGFLVGTFVAGFIKNSAKKSSFKLDLLASFVNLAIVYLFGMVYYYLITLLYLHDPIAIWPLFLYCFILAVPGDIAICFVSASITKVMSRIRL